MSSVAELLKQGVHDYIIQDCEVEHAERETLQASGKGGESSLPSSGKT